MTRLVQDIAPRQTTMRRLLDLRQPLVPSLSPKTIAPPALPPPAAPAPIQPKHTLRTLGAWPWRVLIRRSLKLGLALAAVYICLSLTALGLVTQLIALYAVVALLYSIDSQRTFLIALLMFGFIITWTALGRTEQAQAYAVYTFYFLVIGLASAARELFWRSQPTDVKRS